MSFPFIYLALTNLASGCLYIISTLGFELASLMIREVLVGNLGVFWSLFFSFASLIALQFKRSGLIPP